MTFISPDAQTILTALSRFASSVSVISVYNSKTDKKAGLTVSSVTSVSMEPPSLLVCINRESDSCTLLDSTPYFCVNLLAHNQQNISNSFSNDTMTQKQRFDHGTWQHSDDNNFTYLQGATAHLFCKLSKDLSYGSHRIYIGDILHAHTNEHPPLLYHDRGYHRLP